MYKCHLSIKWTASIQSLACRQFPNDISVIIIDEAHTTCWYKTFERIKEYYRSAIFIGLTATPWRSKSSEYMGQHFDSIVQAPSVSELIKMGYLASPRYFGFGGLIDFAELDNGSDGDFNERQMRTTCMKKGFNEQIVKEYLSLSPERTTITFCAGVEQSRYLTQLFNDAGVACEHLEASTNFTERKAMYARLKSGQTRVISSVGTLTEGFNVESISCVILGRPTRSRALLFQMAGRGLRISPGKRDCFMLDFGENFKRLGFLTDPQTIQLGPLKRKSEKPMVKECPGCHEMISIFAIICPFCGLEFGSAETVDDEPEEFNLKMGELFSDEELVKVKHLRTQIRSVYREKRPIGQVWELFKEKWGHQPPYEWHKGAVFGKHNNEANCQRYLDYLHAINLNPKEFWIRIQMGLEFGFEDTSSKNTHRHQHKHRTPSSRSPQRLNWWTVLQVSPGASFEDIKSAYRQLARKYHPDSSNLPPKEVHEKMQLLNWAYEKAQAAG